MSVFASFMDAGLKGLILLGLACAASPALRGRSAATRHFSWLLAMGALLVLPLGASLLLWVTLPVLPAGGAAVVAAPSLGEAAAGLPPDAPSVASNALSDSAFADASEPAPTAMSLPAPPLSSEPARGLSWTSWLAIAWMAGFVAAMAPFMAGLVVVRTILRASAKPTGDGWSEETRDAARALGLVRSVRIAISGRVTTPMTWGLFRPVVLLPRSADAWSADLRRSVLLHVPEMADTRSDERGPGTLGFARNFLRIPPTTSIA